MEEKLKIRLAAESDKDKVLDLLNSVFEKQQRSQNTRDDLYWNWKFRNSVFGPSILTIAVNGGKIVGVDHLWPWELCYKDKILKVVQPCDAVVNEDNRGQGLFKKMRKFGIDEAVRQGCQLVFNFPNENSLPGNRSLGATYLGKITWWVRILRPVNLVISKLINFKVNNFILSDKYRLDTDYLDRLAGTREPDLGYIQIHRIPGFHQWRYLDHPSRTYGMLKIREGTKEMALIFSIVQNGACLEMVVVDLVGDMCQKSCIVQSLVQAAKRLDVDFIAVMNNQLFGLEQLWKFKFIKKKLKNMVILPLNSEDEEEICSFYNWSMVAGLHDSI